MNRGGAREEEQKPAKMSSVSQIPVDVHYPPHHRQQQQQQHLYTVPVPQYNTGPTPVGFHVSQQTVYVQQHGSTHVVTQHPLRTTGPVIMIEGGNCPACRTGVLRHEFTCCGIFLAICFFPLGIFCCLLMMERRCSHCGLSFA